MNSEIASTQGDKVLSLTFRMTRSLLLVMLSAAAFPANALSGVQTDVGVYAPLIVHSLVTDKSPADGTSYTVQWQTRNRLSCHVTQKHHQIKGVVDKCLVTFRWFTVSGFKAIFMTRKEAKRYYNSLSTQKGATHNSWSSSSNIQVTKI